jgi:hypothetical protein
MRSFILKKDIEWHLSLPYYSYYYNMSSIIMFFEEILNTKMINRKIIDSSALSSW